MCRSSTPRARRSPSRSRPRGAAAVAVLAAAGLAAGCTPDAGRGPRPTAVVPDRGSLASPVPIRVRGEGFGARVNADFADPGRSAVDAEYQALLGTVALHDVTLGADGELTATVPAGLASGVYDLTVIDPKGRAGTLARAYRVLVPGEPTATVARYQIDPPGPQESFRPFMVSVAATDATGAVVTDFNGSVQLVDMTGTAVPGAPARFAAGRWTGLVEVRAPHAADVLTVVDDLGATGTSTPFAVAPPRAAAVRFSTPPLSTVAGRCSGPITLTLSDAFGLPIQAARATPLSVASSAPGGLALYGDASCGAPADAPAIGVGESSVDVWFVGTAAGTVELTASGAGLTPAVQRETVAVGPPAAVAFVTAPQAVNAGACSQRATVEVRDAFGNPSPPGALTLALQASPVGGLRFSSDASCSGAAPSLALADGATRADFFFTGTTAQVVTVTASGAGLAAAAQEVLVTPEGAASHLAFLTPPRGVAAGACSDEVALQARDSHGNAVASAGAVLVALSASPAAGFELFSDAACTLPAATLRIGAAQSTVGFHFRGKLAASVVVTASSPTLTGATQTESVGPAPAAQVAFASAAQSVVAGSCSAAASLQVRDGFGNASPVGAPLAVALSAAPPAGFGFFSDAACTVPASGVTIPSGASAAAFHFKGSEVGEVVVTAAPNGLPGATQAERLRSAAALRLAFTSAPQTVAAGACSGAVGLEVRDGLGNVASLPGGAMVSLAARPAAGVAFFRDAACSVPAPTVAVPAGGSTAAFHFSATSAGALAVTASAAGVDPDTQTETVKAALPMQLAFASAPLTVAADACSGTITLETRDSAGNPSAVPEGVSLALAATPAAGVRLFAGAGCSGGAVSAVSLAAGASTATFSFRSTAAGPLALTATSPLLGSVTQRETVTPLAPARLGFETAAQSPRAGTCSAVVTIRTEDAHGNPSPAGAAIPVTLGATPAAGFAFYSDPACTTPAAGLTIPAGAGSGGFWFKGTAAGQVSVTASSTGLTAATQTETVLGSGPDRLVFGSAAQTVKAGTCSAAVSLRAVDAAGSAAPVPAATAVALSASPAAGLDFFAGADCSGAPVSSISLAAGTSAGTFSFLATVSGSVTVTAAAAGLSPSPSQVETVEPAAIERFTWSTIGSPQAEAVPFAVTVTARDSWGNVATAFSGTATLSVSAGSVTCSSSCSSETVTGRFVDGVWMGSVAVSPPATGLTLRATTGASTGPSGSFDVSGPATRSPPTARFTVTPAVLISGNAVTLDARASSDHQTPAAQLAVSWDFEGTTASMDRAAAPPASPWTAWTTTRTASHSFVNNGSAPLVYHPRLAVKDAETGPDGPDVGYARAVVVVLPNGDGHCTVDTPSDADDGATSCLAKGTDGRLSLREAIRLANASTRPIAIDFSGAMTIASTGTLTLSRPVFLVARPGVALDAATLSISASNVLIAGLELSRQASPVVVEAGGDATFLDVYLHDGAGLLVKGRARLDRLRASGCAGACVEVNGAGAYLALHNSDLRGSQAGTGVALRACANVAWSSGTPTSPDQPYNGSILIAGTVFRELGTAVESSCPAAVLTNDTFVRNGTGVSGTGAALLDSIFSGNTSSAVAAASCPGFATSQRHLVWQNASDGCLTSELSGTPGASVTFSADPGFVHPAQGDHRIQRGSAAKDAGAGTNNVDLDGPGPGRFLGANADRGARETY